MIDNNIHIVIIGLGYVGLPTAMAFADKYSTLGIDTKQSKVKDLKEGRDRTNQFSKEEILSKRNLVFDSTHQKLTNRTAFLVTVPTPVTAEKEPDLSYLIAASEEIGKVLKKRDVVIYESTTFPGCTEEVCIPILESNSGLNLTKDFGVGYSPERLSPGLKKITEISRITAGSDKSTAEFVNALYQSILKVPVHKVPSIKVAEAAKLLENCQRDVNISLMNECAILFDKMEISMQEVIAAAETKWNFLPFKPGLVGGHCISVDPYYMIYKAKELAHEPILIGAGRKINESMASFIVYKCVKMMTQKDIPIKGAKALILGLTYKENCPDLRNSKVFDVYKELQEIGMEVSIADPVANSEEVSLLHKISLISNVDLGDFELIILAVSHDEFLAMDWPSLNKEDSVIFDVKGVLDKEFVDGAL